MTNLELLPAVDVRDGTAVRLVQGESGTETSYGSPLDAALDFQSQGAEWIHLVDLDAAFGTGSNRELLAEVIGRLDVQVELSGGIRDDESLTAALATGCRRVNLGTAALEDPDWTRRVIGEHGDRVAVGLDVRGTTLAARGWTKEGGDLWETLAIRTEPRKKKKKALSSERRKWLWVSRASRLKCRPKRETAAEELRGQRGGPSRPAGYGHVDDAPAAHRLRPWTTQRCAAALSTVAAFDHSPQPSTI